MELKGINALVCGMARSGVAAARLLKTKGANVTLQDLKTEDKLDKGELDRLKKIGVELYLGSNPDDILDRFSLLVISPGIPLDLPFVKAAREKGIEIIGEMELACRIGRAAVIAITGTNGKTTVTSLAGQIMKSFNSKTYVVGNIGTPYSEYACEADEDSFAVAELSSFQLETIDAFHPIVSAVLNITPDHLNRHKTLENYIAAKERVFLNQTEKDFAVLNYNDPVTRAMKEHTRARVIWFSLKRYVEGIYSDDKSIYINCMGYNERLVDIDELNILGDHNVENAMAAAACCICAGADLDTVRKTLREFKAVEHRIEFVGTVRGVDYYNDSKGTNPDASIKAVLAMKKPICLISGGYDKGSSFDEWVSCFKDRVKYTAVIGQVREQLAASLDRAGFKDYEIADSFEDAFKLCSEHAAEGDCVLLSPACASWDMFDSYEQRGEIFKKLVDELKQNK